MKKIFITFVIFCIVGLIVMGQDMAVATIRYQRTEPVSGRQLNEMIELLEQQQGRKLSLKERKAVLEKLIDQMLMVQAAEADRTITVSKSEAEEAALRLLSTQLTNVGALPPGAVLTDKLQYKQVIERQGLTVADFEANVRKQLLVEKYITTKGKEDFQSIAPATEEDINNEYQKRVQEFVVSDSVWFKQIYFNTRSLKPDEISSKRNKAQEVHRRLINTSATFADLVLSESEDDVSKARSGLIGPVMKGDEVAEKIYGSDFVDKIFAMDMEETSGVLQSKIGYHIVQISEKKAAQLLPKDSSEVLTYLQQIIFARRYQEKFDEISAEILSDIREKSTINYFGDYK